MSKKCTHINTHGYTYGAGCPYCQIASLNAEVERLKQEVSSLGITNQQWANITEQAKAEYAKMQAVVFVAVEYTEEYRRGGPYADELPDLEKAVNDYLQALKKVGQ